MQDTLVLASGEMVGAALLPIDQKSWTGTRSLYSWGTLQFEVHPLNVHEVDHSTASDWAKKEIAGAAIYREWVGEKSPKADRARRGLGCRQRISTLMAFAYDPFTPQTAREALRRKAYCQITVGGIDVTNRLDPHLISVVVILRADMYDEAHIEIDDRDGRLPIPALYSSVQISLGWQHEGARVVFIGYISDIRSAFG